MKIRSLFYALMVFAIVSCGEKDDPITPNIRISGISNPLEVGIEGGTRTLTLTSSLSWIASSDVAWISVNPTSGRGGEGIPVQITVAENPGENRTGTVTFTVSGSSVSQALTIHQAGEEAPVTPPDDLPEQLFAETFHNGLGDFTVQNKNQGGMVKDVWTFDTAHPEYGAQGSGYYNGNRYTTEGWLISPELEINGGYTEVYLRFDQALAYASGNAVEQFISMKVTADGGTTWTNLAIPNKPHPNSRFEKIGSGDIDLKAYIGKTIQFAFVYKSSSVAQPTWEIMDLEVSTQKKAIQKTDRGDEYTGVPAWMEMPQVNEGDAFYIHTAPYENTNVRNYSFIYDEDHLVAPWVAYPLCDMYTKKRVERTDAWAADPFVSTQAIFFKAGDIYNNGVTGSAKYNRGHQLPSADRLCSTVMNEQTFYYTNIAPQLEGTHFNSGIWEDLENAVRNWSKAENSTDTLYVVTGCALDAPIEIRKDNDGKSVSVPNGFYKALLRLSNGQYVGAAFYFDHQSYQGQPVTIKNFAMSITELETKMGMTFFVNLPADQATAIKAQDPKDTPFWNLK